MHPAYSVILFTTASGAGYGMLALLGLAGASHGPASTLGFALVALGIALGLVTFGLLSSTFHLGHPERAWRALSQWRSSWLSREGVAAVATYVPAMAFGLCWSGLVALPGLIAPLGIATAIMAVVTVYSTAMIYASLATVRAWRQPLTAPVYLAFALSTGATLLSVVATAFGRFQVFLDLLAVAALAVTLLLKLLYWRTVDSETRSHTIEAATGLGSIGKVRQWELPHTTTNFVQREMGFAVGRKHAAKLRFLVMVLLGGSALLMLIALVAPAAVIFAALLALAAAVVERWLFFAEAQHVVTLFYGESRA
jgi:DMSO reductase anchor subunit